MDLSIIIPLLNEEESLKELHDWIVKVMRSNQFTYEILFIDDGSTDGSWKTITELSRSNPNVKGIRFNTNFDGCRPARQSRRNSRTVPIDKRRQVRFGFGLEEKTIRFGSFQEYALQTVQLGGQTDLGRKIARFQLRFKGF